MLTDCDRLRPALPLVTGPCQGLAPLPHVTCAAIHDYIRILYNAMPTHVVLLCHFREMLLWVLIHGCMYSYLLLLLLLHYGRIGIEECLYITLTQLSQQ